MDEGPHGPPPGGGGGPPLKSGAGRRRRCIASHKSAAVATRRDRGLAEVCCKCSDVRPVSDS